MPSRHEDAKSQIKTIYHQHKGRFGYRRITLAMQNTGKASTTKRFHS
ncbi:IS3 family transposase [Dyadobacter sp. CY326]